MSSLSWDRLLELVILRCSEKSGSAGMSGADVAGIIVGCSVGVAILIAAVGELPDPCCPMESERPTVSA